MSEIDLDHGPWQRVHLDQIISLSRQRLGRACCERCSVCNQEVLFSEVGFWTHMYSQWANLLCPRAALTAYLQEK